ncbi:quinoprotein dehydrogenase-associated putative ABC transporter substrate-binding protein [Methylophilus aquaticus]|uniref:Quinoprotein dehydrogenase-associated putative ABC transporter substrate-binding protein n=1 Tax=Methylophilus aquaticus TaxID=1971610 RepID=A0ABT9JSA6_9PROT|nr:quinoprotein dehydrogenase-associated putative ABC transporter substrate-binding protein [Methylophilus aquaticus]MDP8567477.1 quinoprotein dehydrogenase-associated putative ABC transporter substrate-binding protein [Methylophilus aquaticus]
MKKTWNILGAIGLMSVMQATVFAEELEIPSLNPDEGRIGEVRRVADDSEFKVCADPDNMPYSNLKLEGFEDKIAKVLADDLGKKLTFAYAYNRQGFLRNTINAMRCDVIIGMTSDFDALRTSKPYYRSGHVFVWRKDSNYNIENWDSPDLKKGIIGIVDKSPATIPLNDYNLMGNARPYRLQRDLNLPTSFVIDDLIKGEIDVAVMWGPIAGYYAKQSKVPLEIRLIPEYNKVNLKGKEYWNISVAVRHKDKERMNLINQALERNKDKIDAILKDYGIPTVPVVEGDSVYKK